jgi:hypothetical protein
MTRKGNMLLVVVGLLAAASPALVAGAVSVKPGEWSITTKIKMDGVPFQMPAITFKHCLTEKDVIPPANSPQQKPQNCEVLSQKIEGNTVTYSTVCTDKKGSSSKIDGAITYTGDSFAGKTNIATTNNGRTTNMSSELAGKWLGSCPKQDQ